MRIHVIGAHGKVALRALPLLSAAGHEVVGVIRNPDHADEVEAAGAEPHVADIERLDAGGWASLLEGTDLVVWSAGAGGGDPRRTKAVDEDAAIASMDACPREAGYVMVSYWGARRDHGVPEDNPFVHYADAKAAADEHLRESGLRYVILKPGALTEEPAGNVYVGDDSEVPEGVGRTTARATVAAMIAHVVGRFGELGGAREIAFLDGDVPLGEAVTA
ncbi:NAD(P)H-binding protein [Corynebacterium hansenii]|uniref:NAD(P)H-binding protein n=1 Tax=Corynebacterium hansenii TaxID=394964 RepID=A0ABV7ZLB2_9CORY|nr:NAD(P)H-binding protein [Corynebacterium hansenii]WJY99205.1 putative sugar epimerase YhfK [Corynebacterium hansenii]